MYEAIAIGDWNDKHNIYAISIL